MRTTPCLLLSFILLFGAAPAEAQQEKEEKEPSLAEIARKTREGKAGRQEPVRVITNADLQTLDRARVSTSASVSAEGETEEAPEAAETPASPMEADLGFWREAFREARLDLKQVLTRGMVLQLRMNNLRNAFFNTHDGSTQALIQAQMDDTLRQIEENREETEKARQALQETEIEAQRAGLPPGLIRDLMGEEDALEPATILEETTPTP